MFEQTYPVIKPTHCDLLISNLTVELLQNHLTVLYHNIFQGKKELFGTGGEISPNCIIRANIGASYNKLSHISEITNLLNSFDIGFKKTMLFNEFPLSETLFFPERQLLLTASWTDILHSALAMNLNGDTPKQLARSVITAKAFRMESINFQISELSEDNTRKELLLLDLRNNP